jgi:hypothetical protein
VSQIQYGAKLFFSIRVDFRSLEEKRSFEAKFSISGPVYSANATLNQASKDFSKNTKVTITAFQVGGDVSKLTGVFNNTDSGGANFVQCTLGDFEKCASVVQAALAYASDPQHGFPSQIAPGAKPGPAPLSYTTSKYGTAGLTKPDYPFLTEAVGEARHELSVKFRDQFLLKVRVDRLLELGLGQQKRDTIAAQQEFINANVSSILVASEVCYKTPEKCPDTVNDLALKPVDQDAIALPLLPTASYRLLTTSKGIWSRADSVSFIMTPGPDKAGQPPYDMRQTKDGESSIVLLIEGVGLETAKLMFEDGFIRDYPLTVEKGLAPQKGSETSAFIVLDSTRGNPGWRDVNVRAEREALWIEKMPKADGIFYFLVHDVFGRDVRFDVLYANWSRSAAPIVFAVVDGGTITIGGAKIPVEPQTVMKSGCTVNFDYTEKDRWWDSGSSGTNARGTARFTSVGRIEGQSKTEGAEAQRNCK